jgi:CDP-glycerol glycerophosphotransferase
MLVNATERDVAEARARLGLQPDQLVVAYLPTYRDYELGSDALLDVRGFAEQLSPETVLLVRVHHFDRSIVQGHHPQIFDVCEYPSVEDILLAADVLITDYSSVMFDYAVLDRPIAIFAPDWETYRAERGVYLDVFTEGPGIPTSSEDQLVELIRSGAVFGEESTAARKAFGDRFCSLDEGRASERVVRRVFLNEEVSAFPSPAVSVGADDLDGRHLRSQPAGHRRDVTQDVGIPEQRDPRTAQRPASVARAGW